MYRELYSDLANLKVVGQPKTRWLNGASCGTTLADSRLQPSVLCKTHHVEVASKVSTHQLCLSILAPYRAALQPIYLNGLGKFGFLYRCTHTHATLYIMCAHSHSEARIILWDSILHSTACRIYISSVLSFSTGEMLL